MDNLNKLSDQERVERVRQLAADLETPGHSIQTRKDVQTLTQNVINGILCGLIKKEKAAPLGVFIPLAYRMAKELETQGTGRGGIRIDITEKTHSLSLELTDEEMDRYLSASEHVKVEILEQMTASGKIKQVRKPDKLEYTATDINLKDVKTDPEALARISRSTDSPITPFEARKLFGRSLADPKHKNQEPGQPTEGFGEIFHVNKRLVRDLKRTLPEEALHRYKGKYEPDAATGTASLWFTCQVCGDRVRNVDKGANRTLCNAPPKM